jgi:hypothetical protein
VKEKMEVEVEVELELELEVEVEVEVEEKVEVERNSALWSSLSPAVLTSAIQTPYLDQERNSLYSSSPAFLISAAEF